MLSDKITIRVTKHEAKRLQARAMSDNRSVSAYIREALVPLLSDNVVEAPTTAAVVLQKAPTTADKEPTTADKEPTTADKEPTTADKEPTTAAAVPTPWLLEQ